MKKMYMRVSKDKYQLPIAVAGSPEELARMCGTTKDVVLSSISHKRGTYIRVIVEEDDENERNGKAPSALQSK